MARIVVIDDDDDVRALMLAVLESAGHTVDVAPSAATGLGIIEEYPVDLVITDIFMPDKDGIEVIRDLRRDHPSLKIIAMSGGGKTVRNASHLFTANEMGAHAVLRKPFEPGVLLGSVEDLLKLPAG